MPRRWWLHLLLFFLTLFTTTTFGAALSRSFSAERALDEQILFEAYRQSFTAANFWAGVSYSVPLLTILLAHEMGHYLTCRRYSVDATLPYFSPSPTLLGTFGAFILIRSAIVRRRDLFDIGISGPIAGFVLLLPFLFAGVWMSQIKVTAVTDGAFVFGTPLLLRAVEYMRFPGVPPANVNLHPMAMAAWAGLLATAINLLPVGQLDGGHIFYAVLGEHGHRVVSLLLISLLVVFGFLYWPWWVWAVVLFFVRRHPLVYDQETLGSGRKSLALAALLLLTISISVVPVQIK